MAHVKWTKERNAEQVLGISMTVPDEALTIRQILDRYGRAERIDAQLRRSGFNDDGAGEDDFDAPDIQQTANSEFGDRAEFQKNLDSIIESKKQLHEQKLKQFKEKLKNSFSTSKKQKEEAPADDDQDTARRPRQSDRPQRSQNDRAQRSRTKEEEGSDTGSEVS